MVRVKCLAQDHNTMTRPGFKPGPLDLESCALTTRSPHLPQQYLLKLLITNRVLGMISQLTGEISCKLNRSITGYTNLASVIEGGKLVHWTKLLWIDNLLQKKI